MGAASIISLLLGTVMGVVFGFMKGLAKLLPFHPGFKAMAYGFPHVYGPFLGLPGRILLPLVGIGETLAGVGLLLGLWIDTFGGFPKSTSNVFKALAIVAGVALMTLGFVAAFVHKYIDGTGPKFMF